MKLERRLLGVFADSHEAASAVEALKDDGHCSLEIYSPVPDHHLLDVAPPRLKPVRYFTMTGAVLGLISGLALAAWTAAWQVGSAQVDFFTDGLWLNGMSPVSWVPFVIVGFEVTILFGGLMTMLGLLIGTRLPKFWDPPLWDTRLSEDHYGIGVDCIATYTDRYAEMLEKHGAEHVHRAR